MLDLERGSDNTCHGLVKAKDFGFTAYPVR